MRDPVGGSIEPGSGRSRSGASPGSDICFDVVAISARVERQKKNAPSSDRPLTSKIAEPHASHFARLWLLHPPLRCLQQAPSRASASARSRRRSSSQSIVAQPSTHKPDRFPEEALAFPNNSGGFIDPTNFRRRCFDRLVRTTFRSAGKRITPYALRHTFASLHLSRGTTLLWVQQVGGWKSPQVLLDPYAHFLPGELQGYADSLTTALDGPSSTRRHRSKRDAHQEVVHRRALPW